MTSENVTRIISQLLRDGYIKRQEYPEMIDEAVQKEVRKRLGEVGLELILSTYSDAWGVCLSRDSILALDPDWLTNQRLPRNVLALIIVLWAKLILPRRIVNEDNSLRTDQLPLPGMELSLESAKEGKILTVSIDQLYADFGKRFGSKTTLGNLLSQLKKLNIIEYERQNNIKAGPMLDLILPGPEMRSYIEREMRKVLVADSDFDENSFSEINTGGI